MKVLIHALGATMGGAMRHLSNFLPELGKQDSANEYVILVRQSLPDLSLPANIRLERIPDKVASGSFSRMSLDIVSIPRKLRYENFDSVVLLTNYGSIWSPVPHIFFQRNCCENFRER